MLQPFITPSPYSPNLSPPDHFLFPKLKIKLKGPHFEDAAEIQEAVTNELKKVQNEEFSAAFQKLYDRVKAGIYANGAYFEFKNMSSSCVFELKKINPKTFGPHCVSFKTGIHKALILANETDLG
jgi:hypothetical protein